jgi:predicted esterase
MLRAMRTWPFLAGALLVLTTACGSSTSGNTTTGGSTGSGGAATATGGGSSAGPTEPPADFVPKATGTCPDLVQGKNTFSPDGNARDVLLWIDPAKAAAMDGPLVFFWHGAGGDPSEAPYALGPALKAITDMGGVVAAPYHDPKSTVLPWYLCLGGNDESDLRVADEILACAIAKVGVDMRRIHSVGFSAGAMNTEQFAARRSGYLASIVAYSGARIGNPDEQEPANLYPAMLFYGGASDQVIVNFADATKTYHDALTSEGHFSFMCNHNMGHTVPSSGPPAAWQFLQDHPYGTSPEPYAKALPASFPSYCSL